MAKKVKKLIEEAAKKAQEEASKRGSSSSSSSNSTTKKTSSSKSIQKETTPLQSATKAAQKRSAASNTTTTKKKATSTTTKTYTKPKSYPLTSMEKTMTKEDQKKVTALKDQWWNSQGNTEKQRAVNYAANALRAKYGFSGGSTGVDISKVKAENDEQRYLRLKRTFADTPRNRWDNERTQNLDTTQKKIMAQDYSNLAKEYDVSTADRVNLAAKGALGQFLGGYQEDIGQYLKPENEYTPALTSRYVMEGDKEGLASARIEAQARQDAADKLYAMSSKNLQESAENIEAAKKGLSGAGKLLVDAGVAGSQMAADAALSAITGSPLGLVNMGTRVFGQSANEAREAGASDYQQLLYGLANAGVEVATERMFGAFKNTYGEGFLDNAMSKAIGKFVKSPAGAAFIKDTTGEGIEEIFASAVNPVLQSIYTGKAPNYSVDTLSEALYEGLVGSVLGAVGGGVNVLRNNRRATQSGTDTTTSPVNAQDLADRVQNTPVEAPIDITRMANNVVNQASPLDIRNMVARNGVSDMPTNAGSLGNPTPTNTNNIDTVLPVLEQNQADIGKNAPILQGSNTQANTPITQANTQANTETNTQTNPLDLLRETARERAGVESGTSPVLLNDLVQRVDATESAKPVDVRGMAQTQGNAGSLADIVKGRSQVNQDNTATPAVKESAQATAEDADYSSVYFGSLTNQKSVAKPEGMTEERYKAAVEAGKTAREAKLNTLANAVKDRVVHKEDAGFYGDANSFDSATVQELHDVSKALGVRTYLVGSVDGGNANAKLYRGDVFIEKDNPNPIRSLMGHESGHRMREMSPKLWQDFQDYVAALPGAYEKVQRKIKLYRDNDKTLDVDGALEEVACDYAGQLSEDYDALRQFIEDNIQKKSFLRKVAEAFKRVAAKLTGKRKSDVDRAIDLLQRAAKGAYEVVKASSAEVQAVETDSEWLEEGMADYPKFSLVEDEATIAKLNSTKTVKRYRAAQKIDGKYYSPMAGKVNGEWTQPIEIGKWEQADERPEMAYEKKGEEGSGKWYFKLIKGNKSSPVPARYNPYIHSSTIMLNDQFSSASKRPELVVIEVEIPQFEIDEPYKAEKAKDSTGNMAWKSGVVATYLPEGKKRVVTLSRYDKPIREVPVAEVADSIAKLLDGENIPFPAEVITPALREELVKRGVEITEGDAYKEKKKAFDAERKSAKKAGKADAKYSLKEQKIPTFSDLMKKPDVKVIDIAGEETGRTKELVKSFKLSDEAKRICKTPVRNKDTGEYIFITPSTFTHSFSNSPSDKVSVARNIRGIVENSVLTSREDSRKEGDHTTGVYTLFGAVRTNRGIQPVKVKVKEYSNEGQDIPKNIRESIGDDFETYSSVYDNRILVVEGIEKETDGSAALTANQSAIPDSPSVSAISVADLYSLVNEKYRKYWPENKDSGKFSLKEQDAAYLSAVESGDMETAQKMVDDAAKRAGYKVEAWHGTREGGFTVFEKSNTKNGMFFSKKKEVAETYQESGEEIDIKDFNNSNGLYHVYIRTDGFYSFDAGNNKWWRILDDNNGLYWDELDDSEKSLFMEKFADYSVDGESLDGVFFDENGEELPVFVISEDKGIKLAKIITTEEIVDYAIENGYKGVVIKNIIDPENGSQYAPPSDDIIPFESEQIKSADPVTYDENDNVIPLSERFNADNEDIRYSLKGTGDYTTSKLEKQNALLKEKMEYWKSQTRRTKLPTCEPKAVKKSAKRILKTYQSGADAETVTASLQELWDGVSRGVPFEESDRKAREVAETIARAAVEEDSELYDNYADMRKFFKDTKITITQGDKEGITDYKEWRNANRKYFNISVGEHTNVDTVFQEAAVLWPEWFDEQETSNIHDQLNAISDVLSTVYTVTEFNPFGGNMENAVDGIANDILYEYFELPQVKTFADKQAEKLKQAKAAGRQAVENTRTAERMASGRELAKQKRADAEKFEKMFTRKNQQLDDLREKNRQRVNAIIQKERETTSRKLSALKDEYARRNHVSREKRDARELRGKITRHLNKLSAKLLRPNDKQHIPESLKKAVATLLESINLESKGGKATKKTEAFQLLREAYNKMATGQDADRYTIDPDLMEMIDEIAQWRDTPILEMTTAQLQTVYDTIRAVEASIMNADKAFRSERFQTISGYADNIKEGTRDVRDRKEFKVGSSLQNMMAVSMLTPEAYFHRLGEAGDEVFRMLRAAQDRQITILDEAKTYIREKFKGVKLSKLEKDIRHITVEDGEFDMSVAQIMNLYLLSKREQAVEHILKGGIRPDTLDGKGAFKKRRSEPVHITQEELSEIVGMLTDEQVKYADTLQGYAEGTLAKLGNEASMEIYGYEKFKEKHYWPIKTDQNQVKSDVAKEAQSATIAGKGFTKGTKPHANNAVMVGSVFDVFTTHTAEMTAYSAWLPAVENLKRIHNFRFLTWDDEGAAHYDGDVKSILERVFGTTGNGYVKKLLEDINGGVNALNNNPFNQFVGAYKASAIGANIRVWIQQPTSAIRALDTISLADFVAGLSKSKPGTWDKVKKYAPIAVWKDWGYFDADTGKRIKDVLFGETRALDKVNNALIKPAGTMDSLAWSHLWNACEVEVHRKNRALRPGTDAFYKEVAKRFNEVVDHSQVVDGVIQRSHIMRSTDGVTKMATSFMSEPTKTYSMFLNAIYDVRHATDKKAARKHLGRTAFALTASLVANAAAQSIVDALRASGDDRDKDYWENFFTELTGVQTDTDEEQTAAEKVKDVVNGNLFTAFNPAGYIPFVKDIWSIVQGYDVERMDMSAISKIIENGITAVKALKDGGTKTKQNAILSLVTETARLFGVPAANIKRDVLSVYNTWANATGNYAAQYAMTKFLYNPENTYNRSKFTSILQSAYDNGDTAQAEALKKQMVSDGLDVAENVMGKDAITEGVHNSPLYKGASDETKKKYDTMIGTIARGSSQDGVYDKINELQDVGLDESYYILYKIALEKADEDNNNRASKKEANKALEIMPGYSGFTPEQRKALIHVANKSW